MSAHLKEVPDFPEYRVGRDGSLFSVKKKRFVKPRYNGYKLYPRYVLWRKGRRYLRWCHRIVAEVWIGPVCELNVHHRDGNPLNFHADNLAILTFKDHKEAHRKIRAKRDREDSERLKASCPF